LPFARLGLYQRVLHARAKVIDLNALRELLPSEHPTVDFAADMPGAMGARAPATARSDVAGRRQTVNANDCCGKSPTDAGIPAAGPFLSDGKSCGRLRYTRKITRFARRPPLHVAAGLPGKDPDAPR
jgi:hypothetical protein